MVLALIVPYWVNELLRAFAFKIMLGTTGIINNFSNLERNTRPTHRLHFRKLCAFMPDSVTHSYC